MYSARHVVLCFITFMCLFSTLQAKLKRTGSTRSHLNTISRATSSSSGISSITLNSSFSTSTPLPSTLIFPNSTSVKLKSTPSKPISSIGSNRVTKTSLNPVGGTSGSSSSSYSSRASKSPTSLTKSTSLLTTSRKTRRASQAISASFPARTTSSSIASTSNSSSIATVSGSNTSTSASVPPTHVKPSDSSTTGNLSSLITSTPFTTTSILSTRVKLSNSSTTTSTPFTTPFVTSTSVNPSNSSTTRNASNSTILVPFTTVIISASSIPTTPATGTAATGFTGSTTVTVDAGATVFVDIGTVVVGIGIGGYFIANGQKFPIVNGTRAALMGGAEADGSGAAVFSAEEAAGAAGALLAAEAIADEEEELDDEDDDPDNTSSSSTTSTSTSSSTSSSISTPTSYLIFPKDGSNPVSNANFERRLRELSQPSSTSDISIGNGVAFWTANLTIYNAAKVQEDPYVKSCFPNQLLKLDFETSATEGLAPRDSSNPLRNQSATQHERRVLPQTPLTRQVPAPLQLMIASQPYGVRNDQLTGYDFPTLGGMEITVYVLDSGANLENSFFRLMRPARWIFTRDWDRTKLDQANHGSCVLSQVAATFFGSAKNANPVVVKLPWYGSPDQTSEYDLLAGLAKIILDVRQRRLQRKAVVNLSWGFVENPDMDPRFIENLRELIIELFDQDVVMVVASGNARRENAHVDSYPALFRDLPIIVVGGVDFDGKRGWYSQGTADEIDSSAVGNIHCPTSNGDGQQQMEGTSFAAPQVAGVVALILSSPDFYQYRPPPGQFAWSIKQYIRGLSYQRLPFEPKVIWNGANAYYCPRRRDNGPNQCSPPTTVTTTATVTDIAFIATTTIVTNITVTDIVGITITSAI